MIFLIIGIIVLIVILCNRNNSGSSSSPSPKTNETYIKRSRNIAWTEKERYGKQGERAAYNVIKKALCGGDYIINNVEVAFEGQRAECDYIIINKYGVFIIEVKNYSGKLFGSAEDDKWIKRSTDSYGNEFKKEVKNPIKQVNREIYVLSKFMRSHGITAWIEGFVYLVDNNSPIDDDRVLENTKDVSRAIHTPGKRYLSEEEIEKLHSIMPN